MENLDKEKSSMNVASLVLGIISIVLSLFWYITIPTGILAIIFGVKSVRKIGSKIGKAGLITGIIGLSIFVFIYISLILLLTIYSKFLYKNASILY